MVHALHIVTYATHSERYLPVLKKRCPQLVVLGKGKPWRGLFDKVEATIAYCRSLPPTDIVCFVDAFDTVMLTDASTLIERYHSFGVPFVISQTVNTTTVKGKYIGNKLFGLCRRIGINSGMFIGTAEAIVRFWGGMTRKLDDQFYATQVCARSTESEVAIDVDRKLFYNYSSSDPLLQPPMLPCFVSAPGNRDMTPLLVQLGFDDLPDIKFGASRTAYVIKTYLTQFSPEIVLVLTLIAGFLLLPTNGVTVIMAITAVGVFLQYVLCVRHFQISTLCKLMYLIVDAAHLVIILTIIYLCTNIECSVRKLMVLDALYFVVLVCFIYFKKCILTEIANYLANDMVADPKWNSPLHRALYFLERDRPFVHTDTTTIKSWIDGQYWSVVVICLLNLYCTWHILRRKSCMRR